MYHIRPMVGTDLNRGFLEVLSQLGSDVASGPGVAQKVFLDRLKIGSLQTFVAVDDSDTILGTATVMVEPKFLHGGRPVAHIEDVAVRADTHGQGVGAALVGRCILLARKTNCYKVILDCDDKVQGFYEKLGFIRKSNQMRLDI